MPFKKKKKSLPFVPLDVLFLLFGFKDETYVQTKPKIRVNEESLRDLNRTASVIGIRPTGLFAGGILQKPIEQHTGQLVHVRLSLFINKYLNFSPSLCLGKESRREKKKWVPSRLPPPPQPPLYFSSFVARQDVPYSDHSSYAELRQFLRRVRATNVVPIVKSSRDDFFRHMGDLVSGSSATLKPVVPPSVHRYKRKKEKREINDGVG
jgi:hypothetical protein